MTQKTIAWMRKAIQTGWDALDVATERSFDHARMLTEAYDTAVTQERQHRSTGRAFGGKPYRLSIELAAKAIVLHHFYQWTTPPENWQAFVHTRRDCALAYALHEAVGTPTLLDKCKAAASIDYSEDIAAREDS